MIDTVLSVFDGMSCGQIALNKANIKFKTYFASEIDEYAISVTKHNYPDTKHLGSVINVNKQITGDIDLLIGGSPCQGFSFTGKQLNFDDPRSKLFFEFVRLKDELNPKYFLLENVVMQQDFQNIISNYLGVQPLLINSSLFSAQFRDRLYWTNIPVNMTTIKPKQYVLSDIMQHDLPFTHDCDNIEISKSPNGIINIKKGTSGYSWFYEQQTYTQDSIVRTLKANGGSGNIPKVLNLELNKFRKLTPLECERLQTVPDNYISTVSDSQRYKMLGNGWTVDVISFILSHIKLATTNNQGMHGLW